MSSIAGGAGAGAGAEEAPVDMKGYNDYFELFEAYQLGGREGLAKVDATKMSRSLMTDWLDVDEGRKEEIDVHRKYIKHFFEGKPKAATEALNKFLDWLNVPDNLDGVFDGYAPDDVDAIKEGLYKYIEPYLEAGADSKSWDEFNPLPILPNSNNNQNGGRRRKTRKSQRKNRRRRNTRRRRNSRRAGRR